MFSRRINNLTLAPYIFARDFSQKDLVSTGMTTGPASDGAGYLLKLHKDTGAAIKNYRFAAEVAGITFDSADGLYVSGVYGGSGSGPAPGGLSFVGAGLPASPCCRKIASLHLPRFLYF